MRDNYTTKKNKLGDVTEMVISLNELDNSYNLEDGRPSSTLFMYYVIDPKDFTNFGPVTPQYKKLKGELQRQNKLISSERPFKILQNETKIIKIGHAVLEIFNFKD